MTCCTPVSLSLFFVLCSLLSLFFVLCSLFFVFCPLFFVLCSLFFVLCSLFFVLCPLSFVLCALSFVLCALSFVLFIRCPLSFVLRPLCFVLCPLSFWILGLALGFFSFVFERNTYKQNGKNKKAEVGKAKRNYKHNGSDSDKGHKYKGQRTWIRSKIRHHKKLHDKR